MQTFAESPMKDQIPPGMKPDSVMHARLVVGQAASMGSDAPPEHFQKPQGLYVSIGLADAAEAERIWKGLAEGARVQMPFAETFWAHRFGMPVDRFGTPWMVNVDKKMG
jgi:PhnB protein